MRTLLLAIILSVFIGCDSEGNNPSTTQNSSKDTTVYDRFLPMKVGNFWAYSTTFNVFDTSQILRIVSEVTINSQKYFVFENEYPHEYPYPAKDTEYFRFDKNNKLYSLRNDSDMFFADLTTQATSSTGTYYPGFVWMNNIRDSTFIGAFDSSIVVIFRGTEPNFMTFAPNIGILEMPFTMNIAPPCRLIGAKVNDSLIFWKR